MLGVRSVFTCGYSLNQMSSREDAIAELQASEARLRSRRPSFVPAIMLERFIALSRVFHGVQSDELILGVTGTNPERKYRNDLCLAFLGCMRAAAVAAPACVLDPRLGAVTAICDASLRIVIDMQATSACTDFFCELASRIRDKPALKRILVSALYDNGFAHSLFRFGDITTKQIRKGSTHPDDVSRAVLFTLFSEDVRQR